MVCAAMHRMSEAVTLSLNVGCVFSNRTANPNANWNVSRILPKKCVTVHDFLCHVRANNALLFSCQHTKFQFNFVFMFIFRRKPHKSLHNDRYRMLFFCSKPIFLWARCWTVWLFARLLFDKLRCEPFTSSIELFSIFSDTKRIVKCHWVSFKCEPNSMAIGHSFEKCNFNEFHYVLTKKNLMS